MGTQKRWNMLVPIGMGVALAALIPAYAASANRFTSPNYTIDASVGNTFGGSTSSTSYQMVSSGGETIIGNGSGGSYKLTEGYVAQLEKALQLTVQPSGLAVYYPMDEGTGTRVNDETTSSYTGTLTSGPTWTTGKVSQGLQFDGVDDMVAMPDIDLTTAITVSAWVYPTVSGQNAAIISKSTDSQALSAQGNLRLSSDRPRFEATINGVYRTTGTVGVPVLAANTWSHVAGVYDGSKIAVYINGVEYGADSYTGSLANNNNLWSLGTEHGGVTSMPFTGRIDEAKIFSRGLSANEVKAEYDAGNAGQQAGIAFANNLISNTPQNVAARAIVQTDAPGYTLAISQNGNLTSGGNTISAITNGGTIGTPAAWVNGTTRGLGFSLTAVAGSTLDSKWGSGNNYAAIPGSATTFLTRTGYTAGAKDTVDLRYRVDIPGTQAAGTYSNVVTFTGTMTP